MRRDRQRLEDVLAAAAAITAHMGRGSIHEGLVFDAVRVRLIGRVREAGFALLATFDHPHFTLVLADLSELTLARLDRCFDKPITNPGRPPEG